MADANQLAEALRDLLRRDERNTCPHEETHRGGVLWEICDACGVKWADDEGGKPDWQDPPEWDKARQALAAFEAQAAEPVAVTVERERVWIKRGVQSFMLAYEADTNEEREWYAQQLRGALSVFTPDVKTAPVAQAEPSKPLTASQVHELCNECHLDWHRGWSLDEEPNRYLELARAIEKHHGIKENP